MRTKVTPINPQTSFQTAVRATFAIISQAWRSLTNAQRLSFESAVSNFSKTDIFGDIRNPSGSNLHQRLNLNLANANASLINEAPALVSSPPLFEFTATVDGTTPAVSLAWTSGAIPASSAVIVEATPAYSPGKSFIKNKFRVLAVLPAADATPTVLTSEYLAKFGSPAVGQKVSIRCKSVDTLTGITSAYSSAVYTVI